jgi:hypothetical protein
VSGDLLFSSVRGFAITTTITMAIARFGAAGTVAILCRATVARFGAAGAPIHGIVWPISRSMALTDLLSIGATMVIATPVRPARRFGRCGGHNHRHDAAPKLKIWLTSEYRARGRDVRSDSTVTRPCGTTRSSSARRLVHVAMQRRGVELVAQQRRCNCATSRFRLQKTMAFLNPSAERDQIPQRLPFFFMRIAAR